MSIMLEQARYEKKIAFFTARLRTCGYRFYKMIQTRKKEAPRLLNQQQNEAVQQEVESRVLGTTDEYINCLRGEHYTHDIPDYLVPEADHFKTLVYTQLAPKFYLEEERSRLLEKIFEVEFK